MRRALPLLLPALAALALAPLAHAGVSEPTLRSGGLERSYRLYTPPGLDRSRPVPVVLVFHGFGGSAEGVARMSGFDAVARDEGFLAVYPHSVGPGWNADGCCGAATRLGIDDAGFVDDLLDDLGRRARLDRRRIYAAGISNGGIFSYYLACRGVGKLAAIGPVAAAMFEPCEPPRRVSVIHVHGRDDRLVPLEGGRGGRGYDWPPVRDGLELWRRHNGCSRPATWRAGEAKIETSRCRRGTAVKLIVLDGQGHTWPEEPIDTTAALWRFFEAHPRPGA
ncbi:MAG: polyhydroxybutyrate depolymerase [Thermoleophilia bacterium]|nr:polyhydroxybutyrate depolymerase [Thermoleophilia bacterium]